MPQYTGTTATTSGPLSVAYAEFSADVTITATTNAAATTIVTAPTFTPNGQENFWLEFFCPSVQPASSAGAQVNFVIFDNAVVIGAVSILAQAINAAAATYATPVLARRKILLPTAVAHTYSVNAFRTVGDGTAHAGNGTVTYGVGYINISRDM